MILSRLTPAQRRVLDAIGCGSHSPMMSAGTRKALLTRGLIVPAGYRTIGAGALAVRVQEFDMPTPVHMAWCELVAAQVPENSDHD